MERLRFAQLPTDLHPLNRLSHYLGGPEIWIKRDDNTGLALGGNKARKLEYLVADALNKGCDTLITAGGLQSNHARMTAAVAAKFGLECHLILRGLDDNVQGNLFLDYLLGARVHKLSPKEDRERKMEEVADELRLSGRNPYVICVGGSNAVGSLGYLDAVGELTAQAERLDPFDEIVVAVGSGGTFAGLRLGIQKQGLPTQLRGICVDDQDFRPVILQICENAATLFGVGHNREAELTLDSSYLGDGYGKPSPSGLEAIELLAKLEGILLDPVYTGKAMAGLIDGVRRGFYGKGQRILFWHTGGAPALFAYTDQVGFSPN